MNKKLQIFISSIYGDIIEECQVAIETIFNAGHIPIGKDFFKHENFQIETAQKLINESDIFILFLGSSKNSKKNYELNFAEFEYKYAFSKNVPVFPIVLENTLCIPEDKKYTYADFKISQPLSLFKFAKDSIDLQTFIYSVLYEYDILKYLPEWKIKEHNTKAHTVIQTIYQYMRYNYIPNENFYKPFVTPFFLYTDHKKCILDTLGNPLVNINNIRIDVSEVNDWILNELNKNPTDIYQLSSRRFEELIAEILIRKGYKVELTPATRDGGKDIYAASKNDFGSFLYIVECKKYKPTHKVGVNVLRDLYGILSKERATYGIAVTTSYFSKPAQEFQQELQFQMSLQDFNSIKKWLCDVTQSL